MPNVGDIIRAADFSGAGIEAGAVVPFYNVTLSGRYPIFWGKTEANTGWLVCDGGSDLHGGNVPNLSNRFIMGVTSVSGAKKTGGSTAVSGTIGATTLSANNYGSHQHYIGWTGRSSGNNNIGTVYSSSSAWHRDIHGETYYFSGFNLGTNTNKRTSSYPLLVGNYRSSTGTGAGILTYPISGTTFESYTLPSSTVTSSGASNSHTHSFSGTATPPYYSLIYLVKLP